VEVGLVSSWLAEQILVGLFGLYWPHLKSALKMRLAFWLSFGLFYAGIGSYEGKYCYSTFFGNASAKFL